MGGVNFDPEKDIPDLSGRIILVTGGNSGLGAESVRQLAKHKPAQLWLAARSMKTAEDVLGEVEKDNPGLDIRILKLDLGSLENVKEAADTFNKATSRLDILMLNAGIAFTPPGLTTDGYELQFGTNHVGHALFTKLLMPKMLQTSKEPGADVRVIVLSSEGHKFTPSSGLNLTSMHTDMKQINTAQRYGISKLANLYFVRELARRYPQIKTVAIHPGNVGTPVSRGIKQSYPRLSFAIDFIWSLAGTSIPVGTKCQLWAATAKGVESGGYFEPVGRPGSLSKLGKDTEQRPKELWDWTESELAKHGSEPGWPDA